MLSLFRIPLRCRKSPSASSLSPMYSSLRSVLLVSLNTTGFHDHHHSYHTKVNVSVTETIKPSSPTPTNLATFKLSLIDNQCAPFYVPFVFFYPAPAGAGEGSKPVADRLENLKSSLAKTLTRFYPLAGRLLTSTETPDSVIPIVGCIDAGIPFSSATVDDQSMAEFLGKRPEVDALYQFLPFPADMISTASGLETAPQLGFRATAFPCGGLALGVCMFHKIVDGATLGDFLKLWSAFSRSDGKIEEEAGYAHNRAATELLPARGEDVVVAAATDQLGKSEEAKKIVTRRFVFDAEAVGALKAKARSDRVPQPSRSEVVAAFLWKSAVKALSSDLPAGSSIRSVATTAVNLRSRLTEPWPDYSIGNIYWTALLFYRNKLQQDRSLEDDETKTLQELVGEMRGSVTKIDKDFMVKLQGEGGRQEFLRNQEVIWKTAFSTDAIAEDGSIVIPFTISSLVGLKMYDIDFGWGKPAWVSMTTHTYAIKNMLALMESPIKNGVEAWLTLYEHDMKVLEQQPEFFTYAKNNTPVI